jgi:hypothetical protein
LTGGIIPAELPGDLLELLGVRADVGEIDIVQVSGAMNRRSPWLLFGSRHNFIDERALFGGGMARLSGRCPLGPRGACAFTELGGCLAGAAA